MANQQHIEWLLEGVEAWNARREREEFVPDFEREDLTATLGDIFARSDVFDVENIFDTGNLRSIDFSDANLKGATLRTMKLIGADLRRADIRDADLSGANLTDADLRGVISDGADFTGAVVKNANVLTLKLNSNYPLTNKNQVKGGCTNLFKIKGISQDQIDSMMGDGGSLFPPGLMQPAHWPKLYEKSDSDEKIPPYIPPTLPDRAAILNTVTTSNNRLTLAAAPSPPRRSDLEVIYEEVIGSAKDLRRLSNIGNMSAVMESALNRFLASIPKNYSDLEQVRFGVGAATLRLRFEGERSDLANSAPEKIGHIEALLYAADLITARLPQWQTFLAEEQEERAIIADHIEEIDDLLKDAGERLENAPDTFDPSIFHRIREYVDAKSIEGYLAGTDLLTNIAHKTFSLVLDLLKDTASASRKIAIHAIATALISELSVTFLKLAGIIPNKYQWLVNWLDFLQKIL